MLQAITILSACVQAFLGIVSRNVDLMEGAVSQAEKDLEPSKIRKVFSSLPSFGVSLYPSLYGRPLSLPSDVQYT